jgi:hypothetical protein
MDKAMTGNVKPWVLSYEKEIFANNSSACNNAGCTAYLPPEA